MNTIAIAELNWGRWIVNCPYCNGAELDNGKDFLCQSCKMKGNNGQPLPVVRPDNIADIERAVKNRPAENRNWKPGESTEQLEKENDEHKTELSIS